MNINYRNEHIIDAETFEDGHEEITVLCPNCLKLWLLEEGDICVEPWPRFECPSCGEWIPMF